MYDEMRDSFYLSKGHGSMALYATLALIGRFVYLKQLCAFLSKINYNSIGFIK